MKRCVLLSVALFWQLWIVGGVNTSRDGYLKDGIGLRGMGQRDPLVEYQEKATRCTTLWLILLGEEVVQLLFNIDLELIAREAEENEAVENSGSSENP